MKKMVILCLALILNIGATIALEKDESNQESSFFSFLKEKVEGLTKDLKEKAEDLEKTAEVIKSILMPQSKIEATILNLSDEVILKIFPHLQLKDACSLSLSCKRFSLLFKDPKLVGPYMNEEFERIHDLFSTDYPKDSEEGDLIELKKVTYLERLASAGHTEALNYCLNFIKTRKPETIDPSLALWAIYQADAEKLATLNGLDIARKTGARMALQASKLRDDYDATLEPIRSTVVKAAHDNVQVTEVSISITKETLEEIKKFNKKAEAWGYPKICEIEIAFIEALLYMKTIKENPQNFLLAQDKIKVLEEMAEKGDLEVMLTLSMVYYPPYEGRKYWYERAHAENGTLMAMQRVVGLEHRLEKIEEWSKKINEALCLQHGPGKFDIWPKWEEIDNFDKGVNEATYPGWGDKWRKIRRDMETKYGEHRR